MTHDEELETVNGIIKSTQFAIVTTHSSDGSLYSRPLGVLDADFTGTVWFFTEEPSPKTEDVAYDSHVNVSYADGASHISLAGTATITRDAALIEKFWNPWVAAWFPDGKDDPKVALLEITADSVEYWHVDKPGVVRAFESVKALITRTTPDVGEARVVEL